MKTKQKVICKDCIHYDDGECIAVECSVFEPKTKAEENKNPTTSVQWEDRFNKSWKTFKCYSGLPVKEEDYRLFWSINKNSETYEFKPITKNEFKFTFGLMKEKLGEWLMTFIKFLLAQQREEVIKEILEMINQAVYSTHNPTKSCQCDYCEMKRYLEREIKQKYNL